MAGVARSGEASALPPVLSLFQIESWPVNVFDMTAVYARPVVAGFKVKV